MRVLMTTAVAAAALFAAGCTAVTLYQLSPGKYAAATGCSH